MTSPLDIIPPGTAVLMAMQHGLTMYNKTTIIVKTIKGFDVCLWQAAFNWRLVLQSHTDWTCFSNGWCYTGPQAWDTAFAQAQAWPDDDDGRHVPSLWYKNPYTGEIRPEFLNE
jgi:hypothetical protein